MVKGDYFTGLTPAGIIRCGRVHDLEGTLDEMGEQLVAPAQGRWECQTIGFSKSTQMHDIVISLFVNRSEFGLRI